MNFINQYKPIDANTIARLAPAALLDEKPAARSERYNFVDTMSVVKFFITAGLIPVLAGQAKERKKKYELTWLDPDHEDDNKVSEGWHLISFMKASDVALLGNTRKGSVLNLVNFTNSHDGKRGIKMSSGLLRQVCSNGLVVNNEQYRYGSSHTNDLSNLFEEAMNVLRVSGEAHTLIERGQSKVLDLNSDEYRWLDNKMLVAKYGEDHNLQLDTRRLYFPHHLEGRYPTNKVDLWSFFNDRQELLTKGGANIHRKSGEKSEPTKVRAINSAATNYKTQGDFWGVYAEALENF